MDNRLRQVALLGAGGMAEVHLAVQEGPGGYQKLVVLKRALDGGDDALLDAIAHEARILGSLSHPHIVQVVDFRAEQKTATLILEFIFGLSLQMMNRLCWQDDQAVPWPVAVQVALDAASALSHAHAAQTVDGTPLEIVHADVSPDNIVVGETGITKLVDFGAALSRYSQPRGGVFRGKPAYVSPEQAYDRSIDARSDVFSLATCLFESLHGAALFERDDAKSSMEAVVGASIPALAVSLPPALSQMLYACLSRDVSARPTMRALQSSLAEVARAHPEVSATNVARFLHQTFGDKLKRRRKRLRALVAGQGQVQVLNADMKDTGLMMVVENLFDQTGHGDD